MGKIFEQIISSKTVQIANKHLKRYSTPLIITEMQILSQQGMITHSLTEKVCQTRGGSEWTRTLIYLGMKMIQLWRDVKWCNYFGKGRSGVFFYKSKHTYTLWPSNPTPTRYSPREIKIYVHQETCTQIFTVF